METISNPGTTDHAVLGLLAFGERSGYDLSRVAARSIEYMWAPSRSQIYKVLPRLVAWGLATSRPVTQERRPDKQLYRLTDAGRARLAAWVEEVEDDPEGGPGVFLLRIFYGWAGAPEAAAAQLRAYRALIERRLERYEAIEAGLAPDEPPHSRIVLGHGIARARATLAWAGESERDLLGASTP
jgi:DNA-binding PadR family transcriptional regulator